MKGFLAAFALTLLAAGCGRSDGPSMGTVRGTVTMDGAPLAGVDVVFQPESGRPSIGSTDSSGRYQLKYSVQKDGALVGRHVVSISPPEVDPEASNQQVFPVKIPVRYNQASGLTAEVKAGRNSIDFALESK